MPVALITPPDGNPIIHEGRDDISLFDGLCDFVDVPNEAKESPEAMKEWLNTLPPPTGWFADVDEAKAFQKRVQIERDAKLIKAALKHFDVTQRELTSLLGLADPQGDGSPVRRIAAAKQGLSGVGRRVLAYLELNGGLDRKAENEALNRIGNGEWRNVMRSDMRSSRSGDGIKKR
ncbi:hypothetical protein [Roseibium album]|uniref:hypothetical protein n=1 Tax=Roseibium album TaxID=311410 RepID=UPI00391C04D8